MQDKELRVVISGGGTGGLQIVAAGAVVEVEGSHHKLHLEDAHQGVVVAKRVDVPEYQRDLMRRTFVAWWCRW